jgi:hypothetical protein
MKDATTATRDYVRTRVGVQEDETWTSSEMLKSLMQTFGPMIRLFSAELET